MRIIGGSYRGKKLFSPQSEQVRPTSDRAREAIFNILYSKLSSSFDEQNLIELYAGSGAFSLEAISRGFRKACMIDINTSSLSKNVALFPKEKDKIKIIKSDATNLPFSTESYDVAFLDAPYRCIFHFQQENWRKSKYKY